MRRRDLLRTVGAGALTGGAFPLFGQEEFAVYTEYPRLLLTRQRSRLLKRERERKSERWQQFETLMAGKAQMPEPAFALALYYHVTGDEAFGKQAIQAAMAPGMDARQVAIVYDWCQNLLSDTASQREQLRTRLLRVAQQPGVDLLQNRTRAFAAIVTAEKAGDAPNLALEDLVIRWWRKEFAPGLVSGARTVAAAEGYALLELLHGVRDNLQIELQNDAGGYFKEFASQRVLSYYPPRYPAAENQYRIPFYSGKAEPDLRVASLARAAELSLVAYDNNSTENQFLQGWLSNDAFQLKSSFGCPYEFLWANPYQPGLSYQHIPLRMHDRNTGRLLLRSDWDEEASWAGYIDGRLQTVRDGKIQTGQAGTAEKPLLIGEAAVIAGNLESGQMKWQLAAGDPENWFVVGLKPMAAFDIEVDDEELAEDFSDRGGILALKIARREGIGVRLRLRV